MKRSEMIDFIECELIKIIAALKYKSDKDFAFFKRSATNLLDMIQGFDMLPPKTKKKDYEAYEWDKEE